MYDGDTFTHNGFRFRFDTERDHDMGPPWKEHDGHGPVSEWTTRDKRPGERVLVKDGHSARYYDVVGALATAKRDGWGLSEGETAKMAEGLGRAPTQKEIRAAAVERDLEHLHGWCNDEWYWIGVVVTLLDAHGNRTTETESLWGIESDAGEYLDEVARELADSIIHEIGEDATEIVIPEQRIPLKA